MARGPATDSKDDEQCGLHRTSSCPPPTLIPHQPPRLCDLLSPITSQVTVDCVCGVTLTGMCGHPRPCSAIVLFLPAQCQTTANLQVQQAQKALPGGAGRAAPNEPSTRKPGVSPGDLPKGFPVGKRSSSSFPLSSPFTHREPR